MQNMLILDPSKRITAAEARDEAKFIASYKKIDALYELKQRDLEQFKQYGS